MCCLIYYAAAILVFAIIARLIERHLRKPYVDKLTERYVLITGCDSGFGKLLVKQLDVKGVHVFAACLNAKGAEEIDKETSERTKALVLDVTKHDHIEAALEEVKRSLPSNTGLWGLVNNAGISVACGLQEWHTREDYQRVLDVNILGLMDMTVTFLPLIRKAKGRIVNVASMEGRFALPSGAYAVSKFGVEAFSDSVRREAKMFHYGINVAIIEPGFFRTLISSKNNFTNNLDKAWERLKPERKEEYIEEGFQMLRQNVCNMLDNRTSTKLHLVSDAMEHALFSQWPKTRYGVGWDAKYIWIPLSYVPNFISDYLISMGGFPIIKKN
ncbi:retinol dehydrogenase 7-like [Lytechinus variegatus]|uniref:retinol dehydrogenase 7-like n=1 Tax=Lytechinus variegatus TaxID=7654 RepID=UPI001BB0F20A|nr:retinol dehydrogenase 7-like [Lytechinus variegatus]